MKTATFYTMGDAAKAIGANRSLVTFLVNERQIPTMTIGMAKVLDPEGLDLLREAIEDYQAKIKATA